MPPKRKTKAKAGASTAGPAAKKQKLWPTTTKPKPYKFRPTEKNRRFLPVAKMKHDFGHIIPRLLEEERRFVAGEPSPSPSPEDGGNEKEKEKYAIPELFEEAAKAADPGSVLDPLFGILAHPQKSSPLEAREKVAIELSLRSQSPGFYDRATALGEYLAGRGIEREVETHEILDWKVVKRPAKKFDVEMSVEETKFDALFEVVDLKKVEADDENFAREVTWVKDFMENKYMKDRYWKENYDCWTANPILLCFTATVVRLERLFLVEGLNVSANSVKTMQFTGWKGKESWVTESLQEKWNDEGGPQGVECGELIGARYFGLAALRTQGSRDEGQVHLRGCCAGPLRGDSKVGSEKGLRFRIRAVVVERVENGAMVRVKIDWNGIKCHAHEVEDDEEGKEGRIEELGLWFDRDIKGGVGKVDKGKKYILKGIVPVPEGGAGKIQDARFVVHECKEA